MEDDESYCLLSAFEKEFMTYFRGLPEREQCIFAHAIASQVKGKSCRPLVEYVELSLVKTGA